MTSVEQGWKALQSGNVSQSVEIFNTVLQRDPTSFHALSGLTRVFILSSQLDKAQSVAERAAQQGQNGDSSALLGEVAGLRGDRATAERYLLQATRMQPSVAVYGILLGEQQVRQGRWQDGTESILKALQVADDGRGLIALHNMIADLIDAIIAGRLTEVDGMKFVNRLDYSMSTKSATLSSLFGTARRSIHARQPMPRPQQRVAIPRDVISSNASPQHQPQQQRSAQPPQQQAQRQYQSSAQPPQQQQRAAYSSQPQTQRQQQRAAQPAPSSPAQPVRSTKTSTSNRQRLAQRQQASLATALESRPAGDQQNIVSKMYEERMLNQAIQNMVPAAVPPEWPSLVQNPIDQIPPIGTDSRNILGGVTGLSAADFRLTGGDITIEIILERCLHNLLAATQANKPTPLPFRPSSIARLELNMRDGLLDTLPPLRALVLDDTQIENEDALALGRFLGDCVVQTYGGVWAYENPPEASFIHLGKGATLRPFALANEWLDADDIDDVHLESITSKAKKAMADFAMLSTVVTYVDPTPGLEGDALAIKLAELWIEYRFVMREADLQDVTDTIEVIERDSEFILFSIDPKWVPESAVGLQHRAVSSDGKVFMTYVRLTGEFLLMGSRKHFARYVSLRWNSLTQESANEIATLLAKTHLPATKLIPNDTIAQKVNNHLGTNELSPPKVNLNNRTSTLMAWFYADNTALQYAVAYAPDDVVPCRIQLLKAINK